MVRRRAWGATPGAFFLVVFVLFAAACGSSGRSTESALQLATFPSIVELPQGGDSTGSAPEEPPAEKLDEPTENPEDGDDGGEVSRYEYGELVWWEHPVTGRSGYIMEGYALFLFQADWRPDTWIWSEDYDELLQQFVSQPTVQMLLENGFELVEADVYGSAGEFKLPPWMTFAEVYAWLDPQPYDPIWAVEPVGNPDLIAHPIGYLW